MVCGTGSLRKRLFRSSISAKEHLRLEIPVVQRSEGHKCLDIEGRRGKINATICANDLAA